MEALSAFSTRLICRSVLMGAAAITLTAGYAFAGTQSDLSLDWNGGAGFSIQYDLMADSDFVFVDKDGSLVMQGGDNDESSPGAQDGWRMNWDVRTTTGAARGASEFVTANIQVFNDTLSTQTYWVLQTKNGVNLGPNVTTEGTVSATVTDLSFDDATMNNISSGAFSGDPIYQALIDGVPHKDMWENGFSLTATSAQVTQSDDDTFDNLGGPGVADSISVWLKFEVTPLDSVNITGFFQVTPVPAPAALSALAAFGLVAGRRRRRA